MTNRLHQPVPLNSPRALNTRPPTPVKPAHFVPPYAPSTPREAFQMCPLPAPVRPQPPHTRWYAAARLIAIATAAVGSIATETPPAAGSIQKHPEEVVRSAARINTATAKTSRRSSADCSSGRCQTRDGISTPTTRPPIGRRPHAWKLRQNRDTPEPQTADRPATSESTLDKNSTTSGAETDPQLDEKPARRRTRQRRNLRAPRTRSTDRESRRNSRRRRHRSPPADESERPERPAANAADESPAAKPHRADRDEIAR